MSINAISNAPVELSFGGRKYKVQTLSIKEFFGEPQAKIVSNYLQNVQQVASMLTGKDKIDYLATATKTIPAGDQLYQEAMAYLSTPLGLADLLRLGLNKCQTVSDDEITEALYKATDEERQILMACLSGSFEVGKTDVATAGDDKKK